MAYRVQIVIVCDEAACRESSVFEQTNRGGLTKTWAGELAARQGWWIAGKAGSRDPKRALCRRHRPDTLLNNQAALA